MNPTPSWLKESWVSYVDGVKNGMFGKKTKCCLDVTRYNWMGHLVARYDQKLWDRMVALEKQE